MQTPTSDQLRDRIDSGSTGEKVSMPDPAAAPLGTDAEAGGAPPTAAERSLAAEQGAGAGGAERHRPPGIAIYLSLLGSVAIAVAVIVVLAAT
jgi:hypothetical protein